MTNPVYSEPKVISSVAGGGCSMLLQSPFAGTKPPEFKK